MINLYLLSIKTAGSFSGVDYHIDMLMRGCYQLSNIRVYYLKFLITSEVLFLEKEEHPFGEVWNIPYPMEIQTCLSNMQFSETYYRNVAHLTSKLFHRRTNRIIHLHTLNLIDFAEIISQKYKVKIITHLHCIPWKQKINSDLNDFTYLSRQKRSRVHEVICSDVEWKSYQKAHHIICVTNSGQQFLKSIGINVSSSVVYNGIYLYGFIKSRDYNFSTLKTLNCIFVGSTNRGKGIALITKALNEAQKSLNTQIVLHIAGEYDEKRLTDLRKSYPLIEIKTHGILNREELQQLYNKVQIGVIGSLQEQCSYAAIEMMINELPIITTDADGLKEMFTHEDNALVCPIIKLQDGMLSFDYKEFAHNFTRVVLDAQLCSKIALSAKKRAIQQFDINTMIHQIRDIYYAIIKT